jgi:RimJ/RimL family protein N-acetyltransferase
MVCFRMRVPTLNIADGHIIAFDQFIDEPELLGQGRTAFIRLFVESLLKAGAPRVVTDPNPRNSRAIRAYARAGFNRPPRDDFWRGRLDGPQRLPI